MTEQWQELKETITELRDNDAHREICEFLVYYMDILEKQMQEPCEDAIRRQAAIDVIDALYLDGDSSASYRADAEGDTLIGKYQAITVLDDLPSVQPMRKRDDVLDKIKAEIRHFMFEVNPSSSESDYACNYILEIIDKYRTEGSNKE